METMKRRWRGAPCLVPLLPVARDVRHTLGAAAWDGDRLERGVGREWRQPAVRGARLEEDGLPVEADDVERHVSITAAMKKVKSSGPSKSPCFTPMIERRNRITPSTIN